MLIHIMIIIWLNQRRIPPLYIGAATLSSFLVLDVLEKTFLSLFALTGLRDLAKISPPKCQYVFLNIVQKLTYPHNHSFHAFQNNHDLQSVYPLLKQIENLTYLILI